MSYQSKPKNEFQFKTSRLVSAKKVDLSRRAGDAVSATMFNSILTVMSNGGELLVLPESLSRKQSEQEVYNPKDPTRYLPEARVTPLLPEDLNSTDVESREPKVAEETIEFDKIAEIQKGILERRRRHMLRKWLHFLLFVFTPSLVASIYFAWFATPLFVARTELFLQSALPLQDTNKQFGALAGAGSNGKDLFVLQSYLTSLSALNKMEEELGFRRYFSGPEMDPFLKLDASASSAKALGVFQRLVQAGFDPTEGVLKLEVLSPDPETSILMSAALVRMAEQKVADMAGVLRKDLVREAEANLIVAIGNRDEAIGKIVAIQNRNSSFDPDYEAKVLLEQIAALETRRQDGVLKLMELKLSAAASPKVVEAVEADVRLLADLIETLKGKMSSPNPSGVSLAAISAQMRLAEAELKTREDMLSKAMDRVEVAHVEADRKSQYLIIGHGPDAADAPVRPRVIVDSFTAFAVFLGIYLMSCLTISILREGG